MFGGTIRENSSMTEYEIIENLKTSHEKTYKISFTMHNTTNQMSRRHFLATTGAIAGTALLNPLSDIKAETAGIAAPTGKKLRIALVGTGGRGTSMWGRDILKSYPDYLEFVGLCDKNEGRVETGKRIIGASCPTYTDFEKMMNETKPDVLIVTTMDSTHHQFIIRGMELGADIITEKPMTTDEKKIQAILDAEKRTARHAGSRSTTVIPLTGQKYGNCFVPEKSVISPPSISTGIWTLHTGPTISAAGTGSLNAAVRYGCTKPAIISTS